MPSFSSAKDLLFIGLGGALVVYGIAVTRGGFGAELAAVVQHGAFDYLDAPIERVGARFGPLPFAPALEQWVVPHAADVLDAIRRTVARS